MIQRLHKLNLVDYKKHYGVSLTRSGEEIALEVIRHHRLVELYLIEALGFSWDEVHEEADLLEHVISEKLEERMAAALNFPQFDPHGDPIPTKEGLMAARAKGVRLGRKPGTQVASKFDQHRDYIVKALEMKVPVSVICRELNASRVGVDHYIKTRNNFR